MKKSFFIAIMISAAFALSCNKKAGDNQTTDNTETAEQTQEQEPQKTQEQKSQQANAKIEVGEMAPDFTLNDLDGKPLSLSSLRGKHVVIDFWGTWCIYCVLGMPEMKNYYDKYSDKLEILSVDCGDAPEDWKNAVKDIGMNWKNVINDEKNDISELYKVEGFPTKIVLDPKGKILKVVVGEDPAFYEYLDSLFN